MLYCTLNIALYELPRIVGLKHVERNFLKKIYKNIPEVIKTHLITKCNWQKINNIKFYKYIRVTPIMYLQFYK